MERDLDTSIRSTILSQITRIAEQQKKTIAPLTDGLALADSGLDSLCFAILVASLDDILDVDPFSDDTDIEFPVTLGEFIRLYEDAAV
jgi:hypothetical protein